MKTGILTIGFKTLSLTAMLFLFIACGSPLKVTNVGLTATESNSDIFANLSMSFTITGNILIPTATINFANPEEMTQIIGSLILSSANKVNTVGIAVNLSAITKLEPTTALLPNGKPVANYISGLGSSEVVSVPIVGNNEVYLAADSGVAMMGFAITFGGLDTLGRILLGSDLFIPFTVNDFTGYIGLYSSTETNKTGIAFFADISKIIDPAALLSIKEGKGLVRSNAVPASYSKSKLSFRGVNATVSSYSKLNSLLSSSQNKTLSLVK